MFGAKFFGLRYYARRYFGHFGITIALTVEPIALQGSFAGRQAFVGTFDGTLEITGTL